MKARAKVEIMIPSVFLDSESTFKTHLRYLRDLRLSKSEALRWLCHEEGVFSQHRIPEREDVVGLITMTVSER